MKSPEQFGELPEEPREEPVKGKEAKEGEPASPESYDEARWSELKKGKVSTQVYLKGKEMGVPPEELDRFARDVIEAELRKEHYMLVYDFRKLTGIERAKPPETYDKEGWEKLKQSGSGRILVIAKGYEMGVPQEELDRFAGDVIARESEKQGFAFVYRFRKNMGIGTSEEIKAVGEQAYKFLFDNRDFGSAAAMAEDVYGRESEEWKRASEASDAKWKRTEEKRKKKEGKMEDEERELKASISKEATFADLFNAIDAIEEEKGLGELHFEEELWDNFDEAVVEEVLAFRGMQADKAATTRVVDFFRERGYSEKDISVYLPVKFKRERKKKE